MMQDIAMHIIDLGNNSVRAGARNITVSLEIDAAADIEQLSIRDDGCGMDAETLKKAQDPFYTSRDNRRSGIGLGIPFIKELSELCEGSFRISSAPGSGTLLEARFRRSSWDLPPLGDIGGAITTLIAAGAQIRYRFHYRNGKKIFDLDTSAVQKELNGVRINEPEILEWLSSYINENIETGGHER